MERNHPFLVNQRSFVSAFLSLLILEKKITLWLIINIGSFGYIFERRMKRRPILQAPFSIQIVSIHFEVLWKAFKMNYEMAADVGVLCFPVNANRRSVACVLCLTLELCEFNSPTVYRFSFNRAWHVTQVSNNKCSHIHGTLRRLHVEETQGGETEWEDWRDHHLDREASVTG